MAASLYDPGKIAVNLAGIDIQGFADGTFVSVERSVETFTKVAGADGRVVRVRSRDKTGTVTITLLSVSESNTALAALALADELNATGTGPFMIKDTVGNALVTGDEAWIEKWPTVDAAKDHSPREWVIGVANLNYISL